MRHHRATAILAPLVLGLALAPGPARALIRTRAERPLSADTAPADRQCLLGRARGFRG
jgi:hypothetical protein